MSTEKTSIQETTPVFTQVITIQFIGFERPPDRKISNSNILAFSESGKNVQDKNFFIKSRKIKNNKT